MKIDAYLSLYSLLLFTSFCTVSTVNAQSTAVIPPWTIKSGSTVLGYFISDLGGDIIFGIEDGTTTVPIRIRRSSGNIYLEGNEPRVFYTEPGCTGTVYLNDQNGDMVRAATNILGTTYGVGADPSNSAILRLYKGTGSSVADPGLQSTYINGSCTNGSPFGPPFRTATAILTFPFSTPIPNGFYHNGVNFAASSIRGEW